MKVDLAPPSGTDNKRERAIYIYIHTCIQASCVEITASVLNNWVTCWGVQLHSVHMNAEGKGRSHHTYSRTYC